MNLLPLLVLLLASTSVLRADVSVVDDRKMQVERAENYISPTNGLGSWIWASNTTDRQTCKFWKSFDLPQAGKVAKARLTMTADNEFTLYLDGRELGRGVEWRELYVFDLTSLLTPGQHILAARCYNGASYAGMLLGLQVDLTDGHRIKIKSDSSWRVVPDNVRHWETRTESNPDWFTATVMAPFGSLPWWSKPDAVIMMPALRPVKLYFWQTGWFQVTLLVLCVLVILISLRLMAQLALHQKERQLLQAERARIAREIHDDIGSRMTQLVLNGEVAQSGLPDGSETQLQLTQICDEARELLSTMDEILWAINPQRDTVRDFEAFVCKWAQDFLKPTQIQCLFEVDSDISAAGFNLPLRRSLLIAIKETLNNAVKHSEATELRLRIHGQSHALVVVVQDNGKGFDPLKLKPDRNGLTNIQQRMKEMDGSCRITSQPGQGCRVEFNIPLEQRRRRLWSWIWKAHPSPESFDPAGQLRKNQAKKNHDPANR